ncbi:MAG: type II toxin-antitoxin system VapC family toxin [Promethearchaeota archaeon]|nr:MAG: type II toxin-antitoxin system VapC family toxin [Candidatus Lokiarchaeota archaeon]
MLLTIDSQIWIYYFDPNAKENKNVEKWFEGILAKEEIMLSSIIPLEVAHNLYAVPDLDKLSTENLILKWVTQENITFIPVDTNIMLLALELLKANRSKGIGGRDCLILASMLAKDVEALVTHDKNLLKITSLLRIDPVFVPPLILNKGEEFNDSTFVSKKN